MNAARISSSELHKCTYLLSVRLMCLDNEQLWSPQLAGMVGTDLYVLMCCLEFRETDQWLSCLRPSSLPNVQCLCKERLCLRPCDVRVCHWVAETIEISLRY